MKSRKLDEEFEQYKQTMQLGTCPADPGPERDEWRIKRLYLACRLLTERLETNAAPHLLSHAASIVGLATRQAGWAAFEGAWREVTQDVFEEAEKLDLLESDMTHYHIEVTGWWVNDKASFTKTRNVVLSARIKKEMEVYEDDQE
jgi:hypothetical protein